MHDAARRAQAWRLDGNHAIHRHVPRRSGRATALLGVGSRRKRVMSPARFATRGNHDAVETGTVFMPKFDADGLIVAITVDAATDDVLMVAHMNEEALARTIATGEGWFWSRS